MFPFFVEFGSNKVATIDPKKMDISTNIRCRIPPRVRAASR
jgi:hypothetical protein